MVPSSHQSYPAVLDICLALARCPFGLRSEQTLLIDRVASCREMQNHTQPHHNANGFSRPPVITTPTCDSTVDKVERMRSRLPNARPARVKRKSELASSIHYVRMTAAAFQGNTVRTFSALHNMPRFVAQTDSTDKISPVLACLYYTEAADTTAHRNPIQ